MDILKILVWLLLCEGREQKLCGYVLQVTCRLFVVTNEGSGANSCKEMNMQGWECVWLVTSLVLEAMWNVGSPSLWALLFCSKESRLCHGSCMKQIYLSSSSCVFCVIVFFLFTPLVFFTLLLMLLLWQISTWRSGLRRHWCWQFCYSKTVLVPLSQITASHLET